MVEAPWNFLACSRPSGDLAKARCGAEAWAAGPGSSTNPRCGSGHVTSLFVPGCPLIGGL